MSFNLPFALDVKTNIGKSFFNLLGEHFLNDVNSINIKNSPQQYKKYGISYFIL